MKLKFSRLALLITCVSLLSACSMFGSSKKSGENVDGLSEQELNADREARFGGGSIPEAEGSGMFRDVPFEYNSASISDAARQDIESNAQTLNDNSKIKIQLEGHCDERGTAEYNLALGSSRAKAVKDVLVSLGIPSSRIDTISYGEEVPLDPGHNEEAWAKNRRVHFSAFTGSSAQQSNHRPQLEESGDSNNY